VLEGSLNGSGSSSSDSVTAPHKSDHGSSIVLSESLNKGRFVDADEGIASIFCRLCDGELLESSML
jgi:hypothetical protein